MRCKLIFLLAGGLACDLAGAQDESLDEIVVVATRYEQSIRRIARSVSVADQSRIQDATQQLAIDEALVGVPGLYMQNRYNFAQDLRVSLRGFGARSSFGIRGIRILVDGIPETLPDGQAQVDSIDMGSAARIEVLRGPASSLYGNASGGVIKVNSELGSEPAYVEGRVAAGDFAYEKYQLKTAGSEESYDYLLSFSSLQTDGYRDHSRAEGDNLNGRLGLDITDRDRLTLSANFVDQPLAQDPGGIDAAQAESDPTSARDRNVLFDAGEALSQQRAGIVYERSGEQSLFTLRNYYVWRDFSNRLPFVAGGSVDLDRFFYGAGAQYGKQKLFGALDVNLGIDAERQDDRRKRFDNNEGSIGDLVFDQQERVSNLGAFARAAYALNRRWQLDAGLRFDAIDYDVTDNYLVDGDDSGRIDFRETSPSLGLSFDGGEYVVFAAYARSFETPTTTELANPDGSGGFNMNLEAQTADSIELGVKWSSSQWYYEAALFHISLKDELIPFELPAFPGRTFYANAGSSSRNGFETALHWRSGFGLSAEASYTYSDFQFDDFVDDNGNDFSGSALPGLPEHFAFAALRYDSEQGLYGVAELDYSGSLFADNANSVEVPSYTVANIRFGYRWQSGRWLVEPFVAVNNLFDESYNSNIRINAFGGRYFEPAPVRNYYGGLVIRFQ